MKKFALNLAKVISTFSPFGASNLEGDLYIKDDFAAIKSDWKIVGDDIRWAFKKFKV